MQTSINVRRIWATLGLNLWRDPGNGHVGGALHALKDCA